MKRSLAPILALALAAVALGACRTRYLHQEDRVIWEPTEIPSLQGPTHRYHHHHDDRCGCPQTRIVPIPAPDPAARDTSPTPEPERRKWVEETSRPPTRAFERGVERVVVRDRYVPVREVCEEPARVVVVERAPRYYAPPVSIALGFSSWHGHGHRHRRHGWGWGIGWGWGGGCW